MKLIEAKIKEDAKGKNVEALQKSRKIRREYIGRFGKVPSSILVCDRAKGRIVMDPIRDSRSFGKVKKRNRGDILKATGDKNLASNTGFECSKTAGSISIFPQDVGRVIIDLYCPEGGTVYDPFAGHNSRMQLVFSMKRNYIGVDVCREFMGWNKMIKSKLEEQNSISLIRNPAKIMLIEGSSRKVNIQSNCADFTITSPPYWNIEYYGPEKEQLGNSKTYEEFLVSLSGHIKENYRILKSGSFCCWFVNDIRRGGVFYPYHADVYSLFIRQGFTPFNIYIVDLGEPMGIVFLQSILKTKILPKRHEYILVFRKP